VEQQRLVLSDARDALGFFVFVYSIVLELVAFHIIMIPELAHLLIHWVAHGPGENGRQALQLTT
jgi:hypothetical protein